MRNLESLRVSGFHKKVPVEPELFYERVMGYEIWDMRYEI